jgi:hypothetical protein
VLSRLPWTPKASSRAPRFRLTKAKRRALIDIVANVLRLGGPTLFQFEATCRHALRITLVLESWPWILADVVAAGIVDRALLNSVPATALRGTRLGEQRRLRQRPSRRACWPRSVCLLHHRRR